MHCYYPRHCLTHASARQLRRHDATPPPRCIVHLHRVLASTASSDGTYNGMSKLVLGMEPGAHKVFHEMLQRERRTKMWKEEED